MTFAGDSLSASPVALIHPSIAEIPEDELVERLLSDPLWPHEMFKLHGLPREGQFKQRVLLNTAPGEFKTDADVILCDPHSPHEAVAYEIKRIKFGVSALRPGGKPNKLHEFQKAVQQANRLAKIGFWKVYLYVIVVVDAREQNAGKITYQGLSSQLKSMVASVISLEKLQSRIGFGQLDFTQPMDYAPFTVGTHGLNLHRLASPANQPAELTKWVAGLFSAPASE
jgi:hypothetical protein